MGDISDYTEDKVIDHLTGKADFTLPACYLALSTTQPSDDGTGVTEPSGNGYARKQIQGSDLGSASGGVIANTSAITFAQASGGDWGNCQYWATYDALTSGNMIAHGTLTSARNITDGKQFEVPIGDIELTVAGDLSTFGRNKVAEHVMGKTDMGSLTIYIGFSTADPGLDMSGLAEPVGNGYTRITTAAGDWDSSSGGATDNANDLTSPQASGGSWGTLTHFVAFDAASSGNGWWYKAITPSAAVADGEYIQFDAGDLDLSIS